ncbi:50S ribosomal protein L25 [Desulfomonile tiedjei]|uniref:Large ribosomal subunit protein bL25 n=1 Tax=Desulfomonile tiedjei (strain ATCC 49306 / DSM 6799 / DCB-1) TaxID=706587 RepID=I4CA26_DESTA|nr:50S ribosomal protein L25 [Desulfomonile tiedjei]AFM26417.1 ribosomal protein L25, Ctc-form [Desulfomonile tiedjei DSM 6799]
MNKVLIEVEKRTETGKGPARRLRAVGKIPATLYGRKSEPISLSLNEHEFRKIYERAGSTSLFDLQIKGDGKVFTRSALIKERQIRAFDGTILHLDFQEILMDEAIEMAIPVEFEGKPIGLEKGGDFLITTREIRVSCLPGNIPEAIVVDVSGLDLGHSIHVGEITLPEGVSAVVEAGVALASVTAPKKEEEPEEPEEEKAE